MLLLAPAGAASATIHRIGYRGPGVWVAFFHVVEISFGLGFFRELRGQKAHVRQAAWGMV